MSVQVLDPCKSPLWLQFVTDHPDAGIFHHPAWLDMLRSIYGYRVFALCQIQDNHLRAGIPFAEVNSPITGKRWISIPFSDHCKPLFAENHDGSVNELMGYLSQQCGVETPRIEIRWEVASPTPVFYERHFVYHTLELHRDVDSVFEEFRHKSVKGAIRKAEREGVEVKQCVTYEDFEKFFDLQVITRKRLGVPAQPRKFFQALWERILATGYGFALIAYKERTPIAGGVYLTFGSTVTHKYGASDYGYKSLKANNLLMWEAIRRACLEGFTRFDFGRTDVSNAGLREFKSGWGSKERSLPYTLISRRPPGSGTSAIHQLAGLIIRRSPRWVCRAAGELLYKHFA